VLDNSTGRRFQMGTTSPVMAVLQYNNDEMAFYKYPISVF
jgi:hypothetical protein